MSKFGWLTRLRASIGSTSQNFVQIWGKHREDALSSGSCSVSVVGHETLSDNLYRNVRWLSLPKQGGMPKLREGYRRIHRFDLLSDTEQ
jgi:hypothetical protein